MSGRTRSQRRAESEVSLAARIRLGAKIRDERQRQGLTIRSLASRTSLGPGHLSEVEKGGWRTISEVKINEIAIALGLAPDDLMLAAGKIPRQISQWILAKPEHLARVRALMGGT